MKAHCLALFIPTMLACGSAYAQHVPQNKDIWFLAGPAHQGVHQVPGSNVTVNSKTAMVTSMGFGYQLMRVSAASLWLEFLSNTYYWEGTASASIEGKVIQDLSAYTAGIRLMVPVQSRISMYGAAGGGYGSLNYPVLSGGRNPFVTSNSTYHGVFPAGGGVDVRLSIRTSIRAEVRDVITGRGLSGSSGIHHFVPLFGVAFHF